jgi:hypothetical protein
MAPTEFMAIIKEQFGSRVGFLGYQLIMLSMSGQQCDLTFYKRKPVLDVKIDQRLALALMYGAGPRKLHELLTNLKLSNGEVLSIEDIWTVNPMPKDGFSEDELRSVDLAKGDDKLGPNGETLRKMIRDTYHCENKDEEDHYLRRFIAS